MTEQVMLIQEVLVRPQEITAAVGGTILLYDRDSRLCRPVCLLAALARR